MKQLIKTIVTSAVIVALVAIAVVSAMNDRKHRNNGRNKKHSDEVVVQTKKTVHIKVAEMRAGPITDYLLLPGSVEAWEDIDLSAKESGTVEWVGPKEGDRVSSGDVVIQLDTASLLARVNQAQAQLVQAQKQYDRFAKLVRESVAQPAQLDDALAARDVAKATLDLAHVELKNATLLSPLDGVVDRIHVDRGEHVNLGEVVAKIVQTDRIKIVVNVPEKDINYFRKGQTAGVFTGEVRLDKMIPGKIFYVAMTAHPMSRTFPMHLEVDNRDGKLRPGMIVRVGLIRQRVEKAMAVPLYAVVDRGDRKVVFVEQDGQAVERQIDYGVIEGSRIEITKGLAEGDRLIVVGQRELVNGQEVEVEEVVRP